MKNILLALKLKKIDYSECLVIADFLTFKIFLVFLDLVKILLFLSTLPLLKLLTSSFLTIIVIRSSFLMIQLVNLST